MTFAVPSKHESFNGKLGIMQGAVTKYRADLFNLVHDHCAGGLELLAGQSLDPEATVCTSLERATLRETRNRVILPSPFTMIKQEGVIEWLERWQPDALICEANPRYTSTPDAVRWMHARGRIVLGWGLGTLMLARGLSRLRTIGRRRFLSRFDGMICYSSRARQEYTALGLDPERLFVAHNSTVRRLTSDPPTKPGLEPSRVPVLLFVGRINPGKRVENLISAAGRIARKRAVRLFIVGEGEAGLMQRLREQASREMPGAEFLGRRVGAALQSAFAEADVFVLPGLGGLAVQEAMTYGTPVIVADGDGTQFDLVNSQTGWHVPPADVDALAATIENALVDLPRLRRMGRASYELVRDQINVDTMAAKIIDAVNRVREMGPRE